MNDAVLAANATRTGELEQTRKSLSDAISGNPDLTQDFSWAQQALNDRTDLFVDRYLRENNPGMLTWCQIGEHLRALGYHLDQCQARQEKLFDLESNCLSAVIDCLNADQLFAIDQDLEIVQVKAQAINEPPERQADLVQHVKDKFAIKRDLFAYRKSFFSAPRGPLNFNQRILFLRRLQADSIHAVYQRAITIRHALKCNGMVSLDPVPSWSTGDNDSLDDLVLWARKAIDAMENYVSLERQHDVCISSALYPGYFVGPNGQPLTALTFHNLLNEGGFDDITMNFSQQLLEEVALINRPGPVRVISASVGLIFGGSPGQILEVSEDKDAREKAASVMSAAREWQANKRGGMRITVPEQRADYGQGQVAFWHFGNIFLDDMVGIATGLGGAGMTELPSNRVSNINPFGKWKFSINDLLRDSLVNGQLSDKRFGDRYSWTKVYGIMFRLRIGYNEFGA